MAKCFLGPEFLLPMLFVSAVVIGTFTQNSEVIFFSSCSVTLLIWISINMVALILRSRDGQSNHSPDIIIRELPEATPTTTPQTQRLSSDTVAPFVVQSVLSQTENAMAERRNDQRNPSPEVIGERRVTPTTTTQNESLGSDEATQTQRQRAVPFVEGSVVVRIEGVVAQRGQYSQDIQLVLSVARKARIARMAMRALPPVKSFTEDETTGSQTLDCPICMEVFKKGELIQPFGFCAHEFHSSCLYSWLHSGKTTCPLCRKDLATSTRGT